MASDNDRNESGPEPLGAKQTDPDPRKTWRDERARLGGFDPPVHFSDDQAAVINAAADVMIPPGGGFPAPSEVEIVDFVGRYVTPEDKEVKYFPLAGEVDFKQGLDDLGPAFVDASEEEQTERLRTLEKADEDGEGFFTQLRALFYYGYYARPEVTAAIRAEVPAGADYHGPPQPYGYAGQVEPWPEGSYDHGRGSYVATEDVVRVDIPDDLKQEYGVRS